MINNNIIVDLSDNGVSVGSEAPGLPLNDIAHMQEETRLALNERDKLQIANNEIKI